MSERKEIASPADAGVDPFMMLGYLKATLEMGGAITQDVWNAAISTSKREQS